MARLRPTKVINILAFEEKARVANFFTLLVEIDVRLPKTTKTKKHVPQKIKGEATSPRPIKKECCYIKNPAMCYTSTRRDLFLNQFMYAIS